jgi:hypothetical protein
MTQTLVLGSSPSVLRIQVAALFAFALVLFGASSLRFCGDDGGNGPPGSPQDASVADASDASDAEIKDDAGSTPDASVPDVMVGDGGPVPGCGEPFGVVCFKSPINGASVASPVHVIAGANDFIVEPADGVSTSNERGHFHLFIDRDCLPAGVKMIVAIDQLDFANGGHEALIELDEGVHRLCLQAASGDHTSLSMKDEIEILVTD